MKTTTMNETELIKALGRGADAEISKVVNDLDQAGQLAAFCAEYDFKVSRRNYRKAAFEGIKSLAVMMLF